MKITDHNIYYEDKEKHLIYSEKEWENIFKDWQYCRMLRREKNDSNSSKI